MNDSLHIRIWCINVLKHFANFDAAMLSLWYSKNSRSSWHEWHMNDSLWLRTWCIDVFMYFATSIHSCWVRGIQMTHKVRDVNDMWMTHCNFACDVLLFFLNSMLPCWVREIQMTDKVRDVNDTWMTHHAFTFEVCC